MLSPSHRYSLLAAISLMVFGSAAATAIPLLSGSLVDRVATGLNTGEPRATVLEAVAYLLAGIGIPMIFRELLQVLRRFLVENTYTRSRSI